MTQKALQEILRLHKDWRLSVEGGKRANLSFAKLSGANLSDAYLSGADLSGAYLSFAKLSGANLSDAYLSGADLSGAYLSFAKLSGAELSGANLSDAYLRGAELSGANLSGVDLSGADLGNDIRWERYVSEIVPALCMAGGKTLEEVAAGWDCHTWENCPMHIAFGAATLNDVPALYRAEAERFIQFFDAKLIPNPITGAPRG